MKQIKKLNLVMTYPVHWGKFKVLRDFIQNFYDAVGPERFGTDFTYFYDEALGLLKMQAKQGFSMDWLFYIGASSKRNTIQMQVGQFGEGFKIASLVAYRDFKWDITMESRNWKIHVTDAPDIIDKTEVRLLAYEIDEKEYCNNSILTLKNIDKDSYTKFENALDHFYYKENPNLGELITETKNCSVYLLKKNSRLQYGALYSKGLYRASLYEPLIICNHTYAPTFETREREEFGNLDIRKCLEDVINQIPSEANGSILRILKSYWNQSGRKSKLGYYWDETIKHIIHRIAEDKNVIKDFHDEYKDQLVADFPIEEYGNKRKRALDWLSKSKRFGDRRLVYNEFRYLGIDELDHLCQEHNGYEILREANPKEQAYIDILERIAKDIFKEYICYETLPHCLIINNHTINSGSASIIKISGGAKNILGVKIRYQIFNIRLQVNLLTAESFSEAVSVYMHELMHQFGGDGSKSFRKTIAAMALRMLQASERLSIYESEWKAVNDNV